MLSIFSRIVAGEIPAYKVYEDERYLAFLDINPLTLGHTLVIPKKEIDYIFDLDDELLAGLHLLSKKIAFAIQQATHSQRIATAVIGLEVPHAHLHLIPINKMSDANFSNPKLKLSKEEFVNIAEKIRSFLS